MSAVGFFAATPTRAESLRSFTRSNAWQPSALLLLLCVCALPLVGSPGSWLTLTLAGLSMGLIVFTIASGLGLVFGLMDVMNFGHGAFVALGGFIGCSMLGWTAGWHGAGTGTALLAVGLAALMAMLVTGLLGAVFERVVVRPVYGQHLKQILITIGALMVGEEVIKMVWGAQQVTVLLPDALRGAFLIPIGDGQASVEKLRVLAAIVGLMVAVALSLLLGRTKVGMLIRAGVQDREMVEALGYRIRRIFVLLFMAGSALAGLGGVLWGLYQQSVIAHMGSQLNVLVFLVIIMGGMGSTRGVLLASLLMGLVTNYTGFLYPKATLFCGIGLMVAVLLWRPRGLHPLAAG